MSFGNENKGDGKHREIPVMNIEIIYKMRRTRRQAVRGRWKETNEVCERKKTALNWT